MQTEQATFITPDDYEVLSEAETRMVCHEILAEIASGQFYPAGEERRQHWEEVWSGSNALVPPYYLRPAEVLRVNQQFVRPRYPYLELNWYIRFRDDLLARYFRDVELIAEFGCGNGWNLVAANGLYPNKRLVGLDWSSMAVQSVREGAASLGISDRLKSRLFDFFQPDSRFSLEPGAGVWTVGALEQTGEGWKPFLDYLMAQRPAICVHVEPIFEWYDPNNPVDYTAISFHRARNYLEWFETWLRALAERGHVEILEARRSYFGSKYLEGYSLLVWRPV